MELKRYQSETLAILRRFFEDARIAGPTGAYEAITSEPEQVQRLRGYGGSYAPLAALPDVPYACLRLPTGGGKTILGAHAVGVARDAWIEKDFPLVLWLTPTNTIRRQTVEALKNTRHAYRQVLDTLFTGRVRVFDIADFTHLRPHDVRDNCCVVVGTIQTLRVTNTEGRKVYAHNEEMEPHFSALPQTAPGLERLGSGAVKFSFANLMHIHRPLMIVDEAHNAVTNRTRDMQVRVNPCAIVEFTATPRDKSNILHSVTAQELKDEEMIKLPVMLSEHQTWQEAVSGAIARRADLAEKAKEDRDYIRPVVLFQAQKRNQEVTVEALKEYLIETENVPEEKIAVATGIQRELDGVDLFDRNCPVEYVITVEALKEGWDCSFAYVFCSVSRIQSATDVEQLLGRVLRMPYAKRRKAAELNRAHAHLSETVFGESARALVDKMVKMGFEQGEALDNIEPAQRELIQPGGLFPPRDRPVFRHKVAATPETLEVLEKRQGAGVALSETKAGEVEFEILGWVSERLEREIAGVLPDAERENFTREVRDYRVEVEDRVSPAERGETFRAPRLMAEVQGELVFAETDRFMDDHDWSLLDYSSRMEEAEFAVRARANVFEVDIDGKRVIYRSAGEEAQLPLDAGPEDWKPEGLVRWLTGQTREIDIHPQELLKWLSDMVHHLMQNRGIAISALMRCKFILARKAKEKIDAIRQQEREKVYQRHLFAPEAKVEVSFHHPVLFEEEMYVEQLRYRGSWRPNKCFFAFDRMPAFDGAEGGEEFQCAQVIDSLPGLKHWIRNVARHFRSFCLPTASGMFYPDFVAEMEDGHLLVVEYKGAHLAEGRDTAEKRAVGALWERESDNLFIVVERMVGGKDMLAQLLEKIGAAGG